MASKTPYAGLLDDIEDLRAKAAKFRRVALHIHSPDSYDWPRRSSGSAVDPSLNDRARFNQADGPQAFLSELGAHIELGAITDHMRSGFAYRVSRAPRRDGDCVVLPGMEVNFVPEASLGYARIHLVVLMPIGASTEAFGRLFHGQRSIGDDSDRTGQEEVTGISLSRWVQRVHENQGICIAAHVDGPSGIRHVFRQTSRELLKLWTDDPRAAEREYEVPEALRDYLFEADLDAIEVASFSDKPHYRWVSAEHGSVRSIATLRTFDAHCVEELNQPERLTYVKMTDVDFDGLRDALKFPDTRIRFHEDVPSAPVPFIRGIQILGGDRSFFPSLTLGFTENLNCLIGARGSGKSTVVEALRYVFGYNRTLHRIEEDLRKQVVKLQEAVLADSLIRVIYRTGEEEDAILEATYDPKSAYATKVFTTKGHPVVVADVEACGKYPLRLFGWSEIETLGRKPERQRDLLDLLTPEISEALQKRAGIRAELESSRNEIEKVIGDLQIAFEAGDGTIRRFTEYQQDFDKINTKEVKELFSALDLARSKRAVLSQLNENASSRAALLGRLGAELPASDANGAAPCDGTKPSPVPPSEHLGKLLPEGKSVPSEPEDDDGRTRVSLTEGLKELLAEGADELSRWWDEMASKELCVADVEQDLRSKLREAQDTLASFEAEIGKRVRLLDEELVNLEGEVRQQFSGDADLQKTADLRKNAEGRLAAVRDLRKEYLRHWERLQSHLKTREDACARLVSVQADIYQIRKKHSNRNQDQLNRLLPSGIDVTITAEGGRDVADYEAKLLPLLSAAYKYKARGLARKVARKWNPVEFASLLRQRGLLNPGMPALPLTDDDRSKITDATYPSDQDAHANVYMLAERGKRLLDLLQLEEAEWDDLLLIRLNGRPIDQVSPGQRSSAMLPLIALVETTPLVIDQPEDNLDKRLIGQALANVLAELKEKRQIIVCTHDPNIVVGGDAEQVIVLEAESDRKGKVAKDGHGSVDTPEIVKTVVDLLEGGAQAFEIREKRYGRVGVGVASNA